jgi:hypothetical protein
LIKHFTTSPLLGGLLQAVSHLYCGLEPIKRARERGSENISRLFLSRKEKPSEDIISCLFLMNKKRLNHVGKVKKNIETVEWSLK